MDTNAASPKQLKAYPNSYFTTPHAHQNPLHFDILNITLFLGPMDEA
jgi:hypothetical protein